MSRLKRSQVPLSCFTILSLYLVSLEAQVIQIAAGDLHTCVVLVNESVKCWGSGNFAQLGYGDSSNRGDEPGEMGENLPIVDLGSGQTATQIASGSFHNCVLLGDGSVKCWGTGSSGRLGYGDSNNRGAAAGQMGDSLPIVALGSGRKAAHISAGTEHTCTVLDDGTLKCWGQGFLGTLGYGDQTTRGDDPNEMGDNLPTVDLGSGRTAQQVSTSNALSTCSLLDDGGVKCWGFNFGQLGYGHTDILGDEPGEMGNNLSNVDLGSGRTAIQIGTGIQHTCAILENETVKCWGAIHLGYGDFIGRGDQPGEMGDNLPTIDLGSGRRAVQIATGRDHTCVILDDASVKCWGSGTFGRLGNGDTALVGVFAGQMGDDLPSVDLGTGRTAVQIVAGAAHTCVLLDDSSVKCWGSGSAGQLGYGDTEDRGDEPGEMGDNLPTVDLGSNFTKFPTASPSSAPSLSPTPGRKETDPSPFTDPAIIGGISAGVLAVLAAGGVYFVKIRGMFGLSGTAATAQTALKA